MPRSQASPGGAFPPEPPLSPSVSPASADRGRKKSGSGHRRRGSWSLERPRAHSFDEAEANLSHDSDSDLNTLPTPARKQRRPTGRVRRFLRHEANVVKGGYKATKRNVGRFGRFLTKPMRPGRDRDEGDKAAREIPATPRAPCPADLVDFHTGDELPEALITAVDVHQFDWRACVDGLVADTPSDDDEA